MSSVASELTLEERCVDTIRFLAVDGVEKAKSGHPGMPMGAAAVAYALLTRHLRFNPANPPGPTATASCSRPATPACCCTPCCT